MGARPMARLIQDTIRSALADELLFGRLSNGGKVTVDVDKADKVKPIFEEEAQKSSTGYRTQGHAVAAWPFSIRPGGTTMSFTTADAVRHLRGPIPHVLRRADVPVLRQPPAFGGQIVTVKVFEDNPLVRIGLGESGRGKVLVVDGGGSLRAPCSATSWHSCPWERLEGVIIHGCIRDSAVINTIDIGVSRPGNPPEKRVSRKCRRSQCRRHLRGVSSGRRLPLRRRRRHPVQAADLTARAGALFAVSQNGRPGGSPGFRRLEASRCGIRVPAAPCCRYRSRYCPRRGPDDDRHVHLGRISPVSRA